jgi:hypothetical protein
MQQSETVFTCEHLTAVVLTHNEERMIANCLATLEWCREVIVVENIENAESVLT